MLRGLLPTSESNVHAVAETDAHVGVEAKAAGPVVGSAEPLGPRAHGEHGSAISVTWLEQRTKIQRRQHHVVVPRVASAKWGDPHGGARERGEPASLRNEHRAEAHGPSRRRA